MKKIIEKYDNKLFWLQAAFILSLAAALGSILLEYALNLFPCELCWWQRIFMYPLPFVLGAALTKRDTDVFWYVFPMVVVGAAIALFHYVIQMWPQAANTCGGSIISCAVRQIEIFGFITIPLGSLMAFLAIGFTLVMLRRAQ